MFGTTTEFGGEVPVAGIAGDQQAALFGQACLEPGRPRTPTGPAASSCSTPAPTAAAPVDGLLTTVACAPGEAAAYALEASIFVTGAAVQWLRDGLGVIDDAGETEALAASLEGNDGVYFVPGADRPRLAPLGPLRARHDRRPHPRQRARPPRARRARGDRLPDGDAVAAQEAAGGARLEVLKADGGAVSNRWLMQFQADVLGTEVVVPEVAETTALGAAYLAGDRHRRLERGGRRRDVAGGGPLRAADRRGSPRGAALRVAAGARALARVGGAGSG